MLKVGIHQGPCVAASANGRLDYFGTSVNIASHIQETCTPGGLVLSADVAEDPTVAARLLAGGYTLTEETARLRGIAEQVRLVRVAPAAQAEPTVFSSSAL